MIDFPAVFCYHCVVIRSKKRAVLYARSKPHIASLFIAVIYLAFISLGLPDSLLGSAWPVMHTELGASLSSAGVISLIISLSTIVSALFSNQLVTRIGAPLVTALSVLLTALAMLSFSFAGAFWQLCLLAVPYGLGAGAIDTTLNNYTAKHPKRGT